MTAWKLPMPAFPLPQTGQNYNFITFGEYLLTAIYENEANGIW